MKIFSILIVAGLLFAGIHHTTAQNCGCSPDLCCSLFGFCGTGVVYCGVGCRSGPCFEPPLANNVSVANIVTDAFFNGMIDQSDAGSEGREFYTRAAFLEAVRKYPQFGRVGTEEDSRREIAAFFGHVTHETGQFTLIHNYGPAGRIIGLNGLYNPEIMATDPLIWFQAALRFWTNNVQSVFLSKGFGASIRAINGQLECDGANPTTVNARVRYYTNYCNQLGVSPGNNLQC